MFARKPSFLMFALIAVLILGLLVGCGTTSTSQQGNASKDSGKKYFEGKTITLIVPNSPGKGMDNMARMIVPYLEKDSGAKIIVKNVTGAGGVMGINELYTSKPDGLTIAFTSIPTVIIAQLSGSDGVKYDATKITYLGRASTEPRVLAVGGKSPINSIDDVIKLNRPFVFPTQGTDEDFYTMAILSNTLGFKLKAVTGYEGNADTAFAVVKGDGDGHITGVTDAATMIKQGDKKPILIIGSERYKDYSNVPTALEVIKDEKAKAPIQAVINMIEMHRSFFAPPGMSDEATKALRDAIWQALNDKELQDKANKANSPLSPLRGDEEQTKIKAINDASQGIIPVLKAATASVK